MGVWEPLDMKWRIKLNSENFVMKSVLDENTLTSVLTSSGIVKSRGRLMGMVSRYIRDMQQNGFVDLIENYRISHDNREYIGDWDPYNIHNKRDFTRQIKVSDFEFQGDDVTLGLISRVLGVDFIIFRGDYSIREMYDDNEKILMVYSDNVKGRNYIMGLRGEVKGGVEVIISKSRMPGELYSVLDKGEFYLGHIKSICEEKMCKKVVLSDLIGELEGRMQVKLGVEDRKRVIRMIRSWLQDEMYFKKDNIERCV